MKVNVRVQNEWFVVVVPDDPDCTISDLCSIALKRFNLLQPDNQQRCVHTSTEVGVNLESSEPESKNVSEDGDSQEPGETLKWIEIRKNNTNAIVDPDDKAIKILTDNDFILIGKGSHA